jgi:hypothetical protein
VHSKLRVRALNSLLRLNTIPLDGKAVSVHVCEKALRAPTVAEIIAASLFHCQADDFSEISRTLLHTKDC